MKLHTTVALFACAPVASAQIVITEIMFDPFGNNEHEYVELYNSGSEPIDLTGYVLTDFDFNAMIIPAFVLGPGEVAVAIRTGDSAARTLQNYINAWGADINWIEPAPGSSWPIYTNSGDTVVLYTSFSLFETDAIAQLEGDPRFQNALIAINYAAPEFPRGNDSASIYLTDPAADARDGANWQLSRDGVDGARFGMSPRAGDIGSPGVLPAPTNPGCSPADLAEPFGTLNFFDVAAYIALYNAGSPTADLAPPIGTLNFFDISAFINLFNSGCP